MKVQSIVKAVCAAQKYLDPAQHRGGSVFHNVEFCPRALTPTQSVWEMNRIQQATQKIEKNMERRRAFRSEMIRRPQQSRPN